MSGFSAESSSSKFFSVACIIIIRYRLYAAGYEFTVVSPSFSAAERVVADTVIWADTLARSYGFRADLAAGAYEWSVTGFNGGYRTRTEVRSLTVLPAENPELPAEP